MRQRRVAITAVRMIIIHVVIIVGVALSGLGQSGPPPMPTVSPYTVETGSPFVHSFSNTRGWGDREVTGPANQGR